jgi:hypothetical protein
VYIPTKRVGGVTGAACATRATKSRAGLVTPFACRMRANPKTDD